MVIALRCLSCGQQFDRGLTETIGEAAADVVAQFGAHSCNGPLEAIICTTVGGVTREVTDDGERTVYTLV